MISVEVQEIAQNIGQFFLTKNEGDYEKTAEEIYRLRIEKIIVNGDIITIHTHRPGLLIGKRGRTIDELTTYMGREIKIVEEEDDLNYYLIPQIMEEWDNRTFPDDV